MTEETHAYNSVWQSRSDAWSQLDEAADRLTRQTTTGELKDRYVETCNELLTTISPFEPYWAYPGPAQFSRLQRTFTGGSYVRFAHTVSRINHALTTESYRSGDVDGAGHDDLETFPTDPRQFEDATANERERPYFEVLVVAQMSDAQEAALRNEVRSWRRPDDEFVYELVVVGSGDEALVAARLNPNLQAVVVRRRFSHQSTRDLSALSEFLDPALSDELGGHVSPDERAQIVATWLAKLRPELDLYLMTEINVESLPVGSASTSAGFSTPARACWSCTCRSCTASPSATARRSSARSSSTATAPRECSTHCRSARASRSSTPTGSRT